MGPEGALPIVVSTQVSGHATVQTAYKNCPRLATKTCEGRKPAALVKPGRGCYNPNLNRALEESRSLQGAPGGKSGEREAVWAVVPAAGQGRRMGSAKAKQFLALGGVPVLTRTLLALEAVPEVAGVVVAAPAEAVDDTRRQCVEPFGLAKVAAVVAGGARRQDSVAAGLVAARSRGAAWVLVHDGVRPLASPGLFGRVLAAARATGAAIAACRAVDTIKRGDEQGRVAATLDRSSLWLVQTPQAFRADLLDEALDAAGREGRQATDEAGLMEWRGHPVALVEGERNNLKITTPEDLALAESVIGSRAPVRLGQGYDVHRLAPGRPLVLAGVTVPHHLGLLGHSDADVVAHAVMDALLAAAGLGDIGRHFPDTDPEYAGADSLQLMTRVVRLLAERGWRPAQVSVTLMAQRPKVAAHAPAMRANLARVLGLDPDLVNLAATTTEGLGFVGREEGMAATALAGLSPLNPAFHSR